jgi:hypothetical protein
MHILDSNNNVESLFVALDSDQIVGCICLEKADKVGDIDINGTEFLLGFRLILFCRIVCRKWGITRKRLWQILAHRSV